MKTNELLLNKVIGLACENDRLKADIKHIQLLLNERVSIGIENDAVMDSLDSENDAHIETIAGLQAELEKAAKTISNLEEKIAKPSKKKK